MMCVGFKINLFKGPILGILIMCSPCFISLPPGDPEEPEFNQQDSWSSFCRHPGRLSGSSTRSACKFNIPGVSCFVLFFSCRLVFKILAVTHINVLGMLQMRKGNKDPSPMVQISVQDTTKESKVRIKLLYLTAVCVSLMSKKHFLSASPSVCRPAMEPTTPPGGTLLLSSFRIPANRTSTFK